MITDTLRIITDGLDLKRRAVEYAMQKHEGQTHRDGLPALAHALRVAEHFKHEPELYAAAVCHDVLEDCPCTSLDELNDVIGPAALLWVLALSRGPSETWNHYIERVSWYPEAVRIKIKDIEDNMARADEQFKKKIHMYQSTLDHLSKLALSFS